jgi:hypothetical protein
VLGARGECAESAQFFGASEAILEAIGAKPSSSEIAISERYLPPVRETLGDERFNAEWTVGHSTPPDDAIDRALTSATGRSPAPAPSSS